MAIFSKLWFWFLVLIMFLTLIMYDKDLDKDLQSNYVKQRMHMVDVNFSEMDEGFEQARFFADVVEMDDNQNNMLATHVRGLFFDKEVATRSGELTSRNASRNLQETMFWGDVKIHTTDRERLRTEELRYLPPRSEFYTSFPVTIWKDDMVITGKELRYNTKTKEGGLTHNVVIRIWNTGTPTARLSSGPREVMGVAPLWVTASAPPLKEILASSSPHGILNTGKLRSPSLFDEGLHTVLSKKLTNNPATGTRNP